MARGPLWTEDECKMGRELIECGVSSEEFFAATGRTKSAFFSRMQSKNRRARLDRVMTTGVVVTRMDVPPDVARDAVLRMTSNRSLTGSVFGDPPVGWSALDKMRDGVGQGE